MTALYFLILLALACAVSLLIHRYVQQDNKSAWGILTMFLIVSIIISMAAVLGKVMCRYFYWQLINVLRQGWKGGFI